MYENGFLDPAYITPEEQQILDGNIAVQKNLYISKQDFVVESINFWNTPKMILLCVATPALWIFQSINMITWRSFIVSPVLSHMS